MKLIDSHAHLEAIDGLKDTLDRAKLEGITNIITIGTSLKESKEAVEIAQKYSSSNLTISSAVGIHPQDGKSEVEKHGLSYCIKSLKQIATSSKKVVAIGECGLDYYLQGQNRLPTVDKDKKFQRELFIAQIKLASELNLPLVIHCRNAWNDIFDLLSTVNPALPVFDPEGLRPERAGRPEPTTINGVFHSFTGNWSAAQKALDLGFYISFSGIVTFKNAPEIQTAAKKIPLDRMLVETDSPFLTPEPFRGKTNEPKNVKIIVQFIADLRSISIDTIEEETVKNARRLFGI